MTNAVGLPRLSTQDAPAPQSMVFVDKVALGAVTLALLLFPFVNILHFAVPVRDVAGKSGWLVGVTAILVLAYFLTARRGWRDMLWEQRFIIGATLIVCGIVLVRAGIYDESTIPINFRFIIIALISISLSAALIQRGAGDSLTALLCAQGILVTLLIYLNMNYFPNIRIAEDESGLTGIIFNGERTRSMLINASIGSNAIVTSMFVLVAWINTKRQALDTLGKYIALWFVLLLMSYCVSLTGTRYPMFASVAVLALAFFLLPKRLSVLGIVIAATLVAGVPVVIDAVITYVLQLVAYALQLAAHLMQLDVSQAGGQSGGSLFNPNFEWKLQSDAAPILRLEQDSGGRVEKLMLALRMITNGPLNMLIGASFQEVATTRSANGFVFSDNSFATILLETGIPAGLLLVGAFALYLRRYATTLLGLCFALYLVGSLCFTNGILWDSWVASVFFAFPVIYMLTQPQSQVRNTNGPADGSTDLSGVQA